MKQSNLRQLGITVSAMALAVPAVAWAQAPEARDDTDIVVTAQRLNQSQILREGALGALGNQDAFNVPFAVKSYDSTLILNQQSQTLGQVLDNDPSVRTTYGFGNASEQFVVRGFPLFGEDVAIDGLYGITPRQLVSPELYDQVQILNGASAFLYGAAPGGTAIGGTVNVMPKRATGRLIARVTANYNSDQHIGGAFDIGKRFGDDESFGVRVNGAGRWGDISIDDEYRSSTVVGLAADWRSGSVRLSFDFAYQRSKVEHMRPMVQIGDFSALPKAPKSSINFGQPWQFTTLRDVFGILKAEVDVTDDFMLYASLGARDGAERGNYQGFTVTNSATGDATVTGSRIPRNDNNEAGQIGLRANLDTGPFSHEINAGISAIRQVNRNAFAFGDFGGSPTNLYNPVDVATPDFNFFIGGDIDNPFPIGRTRLFSMFVSDTITAFDERVLLTVGLRRQKMKILSYGYYDGGALGTSYDKEATTPVLGIVVKPTENISLYANRVQALLQGPSVPNDPSQYLNFGEVFAPFKATQYEIGGKVNFGRWNASVALFKTARPNQLERRLDPNDPNSLLVLTLEGEQRNRGIELSVDGEPVEGLRLIAGLSVIDAELRRTQGGALDGNQALGVPEFTANANIEWDTPFFPGFTLTGRVLHTDKQYFDAANTLSIPSWTRFDLGARYVFAAGDTPVTLRFNVDNVADKNYWASAFGSFGGQLVMGLPRTFKASITADF
ncbi:MAG: TonB-dependent receptor [Novosphingobium sp.]|nr:TonB-dependent receptor [Novosphingobium sp.]MCP5403964.1 TonB-dependent receptor [Novosphingobium sp.]